MRYNGLCLVIDMAAAYLSDPRVDHHRRVVQLGALREDFWWIPGAGLVEALSFTHFDGPGLPGGFLPLLTPGAATRAGRLFDAACAQRCAGSTIPAWVTLGRVAHLLVDMACPVHVHRVVHDTDPYEWFVEGNTAALAALPVPDPPRVASVPELLRHLARHTARFRPDRTNSAHGRALRRLGLRRAVRREEAAEQARAIVPVAASCMAGLFRMFLDPQER